MKRLSRHVAVLVISLLMANTQCWARCVGERCHITFPNPAQNEHSQAPPCHSHQQKKETPPSTPCEHSLLSVAGTPEMAKTESVLLGDSLTPVAEHWTIAPESADRLIVGDVSPPLSPELIFSAVLRI